MPDTEKRYAFLTPKPGLSLIEFSRYWRDIHGPLVAATPGYGQHRCRYAQSHFLRNGPMGSVFPFAGMAEVTIKVGSGDFTISTMYRDRIAPDEANFLDLARSVTITAAERMVIGGRTDLKLVILSRLAPGLGARTFSDLLFNEYARVFTEGQKFRYRVRGFRLNQVLSPPTTFTGIPATWLNPFDYLQEFWFDKDEDLDSAFRIVEWQSRLGGIEASLIDQTTTVSFVARELVYFEDDSFAASAAGSSDLAVR